MINWFIKIVHYKPLKFTINAPGLDKVIFDVIIWHYGLFDSIISNRDLLFTFKF